MEHKSWKTTGTCAVHLDYDIDEEGRIHNLSYLGGCSGNLKAIGILVEGRPASEVAQLLEGNRCGPRQTSCADQLAQSLREAGY